MATIPEIAERAKGLFNDWYTIEDILKGNTLEMHKECFRYAQLELEAKEMTREKLLENLYCMGYYGHGIEQGCKEEAEKDRQIAEDWSKEDIEGYYLEKRLEMDEEGEEEETEA